MNIITFVKFKIETLNISPMLHYLHPLKQIIILMKKGRTIPASSGQIPH
jgi:hypothetical protein